MSRRTLAIALSTLLAITLPLFSAASQAAETATSLLKLHQLRLAAQKTLGDFYMFNGMEGDQRYARMINESLNEVNTQLSALREGSYSVPTLTQHSREQSLLMQGIALDYASRSASVGATFMGGGDARPIEDMVSEFASKMATLQKDPQNSPQLKQSWAEVATKWRYIEKSLINYNENSVPFLVNKYSNTIIQGIEQISTQYATTNL